ncbi:MAG: sugar transferase [Synergistaceae bacterium]|jgi:lipopolysaccharide/colanic/teichoic acid biosynthesis glycosyltransferase|nr:sugar transferase [Synergistaceae bacterium]
MFFFACKRLMDIVGGTIGLVIFSPLMLWIALKVRREMSPPAIFVQERAGLSGRPFKLYKYRTMTNERGKDGELLPDEARLTMFGKWLRSTSMDELPQLWNVLKGDMSLVGPRPLLMEYVPLYSDEQRIRLNVRPGITGWAQINGRNSISWPEKFALDVWYVEHMGILLDVRIILRTIKKAARREGISAASEATMPKFTGER